MGVELPLLYNVCAVSAMLKVGSVKRRRHSCLKVLGDNDSPRSGWFWCSVQVIGEAAWSGIWTRSKRAGCSIFRFIQSLVNRGCMSTWPRGADNSPGRFFAHGLECYRMIWSPAKETGLLQVWLAAVSSSRVTCKWV